MNYQTIRSMTDFDDARSGMIAGAAMGGFATASLGCVLILCVIDLMQGLFSPRGMSVTSLGVGGICLIGTMLFGVLGFSAFRTLTRWQRINERPIMAWGTLGEPRRTGTRVNRRYLFNIPVMVAPPQGAPYAAVAKWFIPHDVRDFARASARVVVRIDPEDMNVVLIDWDQTRATWGLPPPPP
jgi:hypothetical protein